MLQKSLDLNGNFLKSLIDWCKIEEKEEGFMPVSQITPVSMTTYVVNTSTKSSREPLSNNDLINVGYLAGRCGVNLNGDPNRANAPKIGGNHLIVDINNCTSEFFEKNLSKAGVTFDKMA
jgi:hypothetical protein